MQVLKEQGVPDKVQYIYIKKGIEQIISQIWGKSASFETRHMAHPNVTSGFRTFPSVFHAGMYTAKQEPGWHSQSPCCHFAAAH